MSFVDVMDVQAYDENMAAVKVIIIGAWRSLMVPIWWISQNYQGDSEARFVTQKWMSHCGVLISPLLNRQCSRHVSRYDTSSNSRFSAFWKKIACDVQVTSTFVWKIACGHMWTDGWEWRQGFDDTWSCALIWCECQHLHSNREPPQSRHIRRRRMNCDKTSFARPSAGALLEIHEALQDAPNPVRSRCQVLALGGQVPVIDIASHHDLGLVRRRVIQREDAVAVGDPTRRVNVKIRLRGFKPKGSCVEGADQRDGFPSPINVNERELELGDC